MLIIVLEPNVAVLVLDEAVVVPTSGRVPFVYNDSIQFVNVVVLSDEVAGRVLVRVHSYVVGVYLNLFFEVEWVLDFVSILIEPLEVDDQDARN